MLSMDKKSKKAKKRQKKNVLKCPKCGSTNVKDYACILTCGIDCLDCDYCDVDGGIDSGC